MILDISKDSGLNEKSFLSMTSTTNNSSSSLLFTLLNVVQDSLKLFFADNGALIGIFI